MSYASTTSDLIDEIRSLLDETDEFTVTDAEIIMALNRAQDTCVNTLVTQYEDPLLETVDVTINPGEATLLPDALEDRIEKVEILFGSQYWQVQRISYRDLHQVDLGYIGTQSPGYYYVKGKSFYLAPSTHSAVSARVWYLKDPRPLGMEQGQITAIGSDYVIVSSLGDTLVDDASDLNSYVSIINRSTGEVRDSFQIQKIENSQKITFRTAPQRSTVLGYAVSGNSSLSSSGAALDDYVCIHGKTCVPFFKKPITNALIYLVVADLKGTKLNQDVTLDTQKAMAFLQRVESTWAGRESTYRIRNKNSSFRKRSNPRHIS